MTEPEFDDDHDDDDTDEQPTSQRESKDIRQLRAQAKKAKTLEEENAQLRKENVFSKVALPDTPQAKYFRETYQGDLSPEAILAAAQAHGFVEVEEPDPVDQDERDAHQRTRQAADGGRPAGGQLTPADVAEWSSERVMRFRKAYPDHFEALKRGEEVRAPANFA